jgi:flagellar basal body-associated protein FliL
MVDEKTEAQENGAEPKAKSSGLLDNKVVLLGVIVVVQAIMAIGITQFVIVPKLGIQEAAMADGGMPAAAGENEEVGIIVGLEEIIVTLQSDNDVPNYLRINVNLEVEDQAVADEVVARLPQLRDLVILTLSSKRAADLITPEGNLATRAEILRQLAAKLPPNTVRNIYFSDLVLQ